jgi:hypothetical protein
VIKTIGKAVGKTASAEKTASYSVVGLTLDEISSGSLPQIRLTETLDARMPKGEFKLGERILVYTNLETDSQALVARTKYRQLGQFLVLLYMNSTAVEACQEMGIALRILDRIDEWQLPPRRTTVIERPYLAPSSKSRNP